MEISLKTLTRVDLSEALLKLEVPNRDATSHDFNVDSSTGLSWINIITFSCQEVPLFVFSGPHLSMQPGQYGMFQHEER